MSVKPPHQCILCRGPLEPGWMLELGDNNLRQEGKWAAGEPRKSFFLGMSLGVKKPEQSCPIVAYRCTACGFLMQFAIPETE